MSTLAQFPGPKHWSGAEFDRAVDAGLFVDQRLELVEGEIVAMPPMNDPHAQSIRLVDAALRPGYPPDRFTISIQCPLRLGPDSRPEPDLAVVTGSPRQNAQHPTSALLIVEVADATLMYDRNVKRRLYARHGIGEYWIVNLNGRSLEVCRHPIVDEADPQYGQIEVLSPSQTVSPLSAADLKIRVSDLLPS